MSSSVLSRLIYWISWVLALFVCQMGWSEEPIETLGRFLFHDQNLSTPSRQGCVTCHDPAAGFTSPNSVVNEFLGPHPGVISTRFGPRKPPTIAYAGDAGPLRQIIPVPLFGSRWEGGMFFDGRATGDVLGDSLADQALGPFVNKVEQNNPHKKAVVKKVSRSSYKSLFERVWGEGSLEFKDPEVVEAAYSQIAVSIAAFERSDEVNPFDSKFDHWLYGFAELTDQEKLGLWLFENPAEGQSLLSVPPAGAQEGTHGKANCFRCHPSSLGNNGEHPLFTDFAYHNIGIPKNLANPFYFMPKSINPDGVEFVDLGLGATLEATGDYGLETYQREYGKQKTPTLRNVDLRPYPEFVKAFGHNGFFKSLGEIVHFYNTRDVLAEGWPEPEIPETASRAIIGDLGLTDSEEAALVAFLTTLSDGYSGGGGSEAQGAEAERGQSSGIRKAGPSRKLNRARNSKRGS